MNAYMYQAVFLCEECAISIMQDLDNEGKRPPNPDDEYSYDSDQYPKGPYPDGGGEADTPQYCDACGLFLENPLTSDGCEYVLTAVQQYICAGARSSPEVIKEWFEYYACEVKDWISYVLLNDTEMLKGEHSNYVQVKRQAMVAGPDGPVLVDLGDLGDLGEES